MPYNEESDGADGIWTRLDRLPTKECSPVPDGDGDGVSDGVSEEEAVGVPEGDGLPDGVDDGLLVGDNDGVADAVVVGL